jgi:hypothetical protein
MVQIPAFTVMSKKKQGVCICVYRFLSYHFGALHKAVAAIEVSVGSVRDRRAVGVDHHSTIRRL